MNTRMQAERKLEIALEALKAIENPKTTHYHKLVDQQRATAKMALEKIRACDGRRNEPE